MRELVPTDPVGVPALAALMLGGLLFFVLFLRMRFGGPREKAAGDGSGRSRLSTAGVLLQMVSFASAGFGGIRASLDPASGAALLQAAAVLLLIGACDALFIAATGAMGSNWSVVARVRDDHSLVTSGIFSRLRHPIYVAMALFLLAMAIAFGHSRSLVVALPFFIVGTWIRVREEERLLRGRFGEEFDRYAGSVKRFIPGLF